MMTKMKFVMRAVLAGSVTLGFAEPKEEVAAAVAKLKEADNYGWTTKRSFGSDSDRVWSSQGKTDKSGLISYSTSFGDRSRQYVKKGEKGALQVEGAWRSLEELRAEAEGAGDEGQRRRRGWSAGAIERLQTPAADVEALLAGLESVTVADDVYSGTLSAEAIKERMRFGRRGRDDAPEVSGAAGTAKFWVKDGVLTKYEVTTEGTMTFRDQPREIGSTTTTEISGVGETKVELDEALKAKLGE